MDSGDVLQYALYAITAVLGVALVLWVRRSRRLRRLESEVLLTAQQGGRATRSAPRIQVVRGLATSATMAEALAGIRLPVHWQPDPPVEVQSPLTLTTNRESAAEMAQLLSDELVRLGYRVHPTGARSARARRDMNDITIEVTPGEGGSFVSTRLTLRGPFGD